MLKKLFFSALLACAIPVSAFAAVLPASCDLGINLTNFNSIAADVDEIGRYTDGKYWIVAVSVYDYSDTLLSNLEAEAEKKFSKLPNPITRTNIIMGKTCEHSCKSYAGSLKKQGGKYFEDNIIVPMHGKIYLIKLMDRKPESFYKDDNEFEKNNNLFNQISDLWCKN